MDEEIVAILAAWLLIFVPVAGLTLRFALKPLVDSIARILEVRARRDDVDLLTKRVASLEQELSAAGIELSELRERSEFDRQLGPGVR